MDEDMDLNDTSEFYNAYYFAHDCGVPYERNETWLKKFNVFAERIIDGIDPNTVLDAGCAMGMLVERLRHHGVSAWGIDISEYAIQNVHPDIQQYCKLKSVMDPLPRKYDLIVCIEVVEHIQQTKVQKAITNICKYTDDILFSSTPFDYKEATHFNVQPPEYWAELFATHDFYRDVDFDASFITPWAIRFRRRTEPPHRIVREYERKFWLLWQENTSMREQTINVRNTLAANEKKIIMQEEQLVAREQKIMVQEEQLQLHKLELQGLNERISEIKNSRAWRWLQKVLGIFSREI